MNKKLDSILESEIKRFKDILNYQDDLSLNEVSYRFYNEADENQPEDAEGGDDAEVSDEDLTAAMDDVSGGEEAPTEEPDAAAAPEETPDDATSGDQDAAMDMDMGAETEPEEDTVEVDVTDIINSTNDIKDKMETMIGGFSKIDDIIGKVQGIEANLAKMDNLINKMESLSKQVELMRPPTEEERRKALAKDSYPYNVTIDQYNSGEGAKNQTELENSSKMSMFDTLMHDYNEGDIQKSFNVKSNNPLDRL